MRRQNIRQGLAQKGQRSGEHLVEDHAEAVQIATRIRFAVVDLLRAHIIRSTGAVAGFGQVARHELSPGGAEVDEHQSVFVGQHQIGGLQVAVHDACGVNDLQSLADLVRIVDGIGFAHRMFQALAQTAAGEVFQRQIQIVVGRAEIEHIGDRAMVQLGENFAFLGEALAVRCGDDVLPLDRFDLQGNRLRKLIVARQVDAGGARLGDLLHHRIAGNLRLPPTVRGGAACGRRRRRLQQRLQGSAQFADDHRVNRPIVAGAQLHGPGGAALIAAARENKDRQVRRQLVQALQGCQRSGGRLRRTELDDEHHSHIRSQAID